PLHFAFLIVSPARGQLGEGAKIPAERSGNSRSTATLTAVDQPSKIVLPNGVRVIFRPDPNSDNVAICVFVKAGIGEEDKAGEGNIAIRAIFGSNLNQSAEAVNRAIFEVGGSLETQWSPD